MSTMISLSEFQQEAPGIYRKIAEADGPLLVMDDGRIAIEIRRFKLAPVPPEGALNGTVQYAGDLVSPIEADGYEPFK